MDSGFSNEASVSVPFINPAPNAPSNLIVSQTGSAPTYYENLSWTDNSNNEDGFKIYRNLNYGAFSLLHTNSADVKTYQDTLNSNGTYGYKVTAYKGSAESSSTNTVYKTISGILAAPSGFSLSASNVDGYHWTFNYAWTDNSDNETGFAICWYQDPTQTNPQLWIPANYTSWTQENVTPSAWVHNPWYISVVSRISTTQFSARSNIMIATYTGGNVVISAYN